MRVEVSVVGKFILSADLAELARPVGQYGGETLVDKTRVLGLTRAIVASSYEPSPPQLVIARSVEAKGTLFEGKLLPLTPDQFCPSHEGVVDGPAQGLPAQCGIDAVQVGKKVWTGGAVATRVRGAKIKVG